MCEYCENGYVEYLGYEDKPIGYSIDGSVMVNKGNKSLDTVTDTGFYGALMSEIKINFCPMCGTKLRSDDDS